MSTSTRRKSTKRGTKTQVGSEKSHYLMKIGPSSRLGVWIDERTGFSSWIIQVMNYPVPRYVQNNALYSLGILTLFSIILQYLSGFLLAFYYTPSTQGAYHSVHYITTELPLGWLIRGIHYYNTSILIILTLLHMFRTFLFGAYKKPREINWLSGVVLLLFILASAFSGNILPWDQDGYWATRVGIELTNSVPLSDPIAQLLRGGTILGQTTLTRFYAIHVLLMPLATIGLIILHFTQIGRHGIAPAITRTGTEISNKFVPLIPNWAAMPSVAGFALFVIILFLSWRQPIPLDEIANPMSTNYSPRAAWYFAFLMQLLFYVPGKWETLVMILVPTIFLGGLFLLPFLDKGEERRFWQKPLLMSIAVIYVLFVVTLTLLSLDF